MTDFFQPYMFDAQDIESKLRASDAESSLMEDYNAAMEAKAARDAARIADLQADQNKGFGWGSLLGTLALTRATGGLGSFSSLSNLGKAVYGGLTNNAMTTALGLGVPSALATKRFMETGLSADEYDPGFFEKDASKSAEAAYRDMQGSWGPALATGGKAGLLGYTLGNAALPGKFKDWLGSFKK